MKPIIYLDMDDVLAALSDGLSKFTGIEKHKLQEDRDALFKKYLPEYAAAKGFQNQDMLAYAKDIVGYCLDLSEIVNVAILTSSGHFYHPISDIVQQKKKWIEINLPELSLVPFCVTSSGADKALLAHPRAMLIDDHHKNIDAFNSAGGWGVQYDYESQASLENVFEEINSFVYCRR